MNAKQATILVVDDRPNMVRLMEKVLHADAQIRTAESGGEALRVLTAEPIDVVLCDLKMPDMSGLDVLRATRRLRPGAEFILMTAYATVGTAVEALRLGAYDYLTKPFEPDTARAVVLAALGRARPEQSEAEGGTEVLPGLIARSESMRELAELVRRIADSDATALLMGETGTGKERVARAIHQLGARASHRFVAVNCAAIPAELLESELFGFARGAFTGAARDKAGLFEEADRGTLFLDEVGELRLSLQAKLTRALEERAVRRVGESTERAVHVRLVAATHRDLEAMVRDGTFREDLWYRLNVAVVRIPPLRDRREDIPLLAQHFLRELGGRAHGQRLEGFAPAAVEALARFAWPGNVRQLRAAVERACVVAQRHWIELADLPPELAPSADDPDHAMLSSMTWAEAIEAGRAETARRYLQAVLGRFDGQVSEAAAHAGVERESFYRLMRRYGVEK